jgi:hypothetical protein
MGIYPIIRVLGPGRFDRHPVRAAIRGALNAAAHSHVADERIGKSFLERT